MPLPAPTNRALFIRSPYLTSASRGLSNLIQQKITHVFYIHLASNYSRGIVMVGLIDDCLECFKLGKPGKYLSLRNVYILPDLTVLCIYTGLHYSCNRNINI